MAYLKFDSSQLINLEFSLDREILRSNRGGSYSCSSVVRCNTRKYHGLLVCPVEKFDGERFVFLSNLDETVIQHNSEFNLGIHKFQGDSYFPKGHKYIQDFETDVITVTTFRVGGVFLKKESLLVDREEQILIKYTLEDAHSPTKLRFRPFLAFRNIHELTHANMVANTKVTKVSNGIKSKLYAGFPSLYMQFSKEVEFVQIPDWYYNIEYIKELERGYDYKEDLFVPGYFEADIKKGESIIFSGALKEDDPAQLKKKFNNELNKRTPRDNFKNCLKTAAQQFIVRKENKTEVIAGYPWFGTWGRDTFISLPGLTLTMDDTETFLSVVDTMVARMKGGLFPNMGNDKNPAFNSVDAPLWFFSALQQYIEYSGNTQVIWERYGKHMKDILNGFRAGLSFNIKMQDDGLIFAGAPDKALTWMDAVVYGVPVTPRTGCQIEINALWYNALKFTIALAEEYKDLKFVKAYADLPEKIEKSFIDTFWRCEKGYLADYVNGDIVDCSVRPNMVIAASLNYSPLTSEMKKSIVDLATSELLTPRGLRTLSPKHPNYKGIYEGSQENRDKAYHQGTVWPWLLEPYSRLYLKLYKQSGVSHIKKLIDGFEEEMTKQGIGTIAEIYNGDPPHHAKGAISQAWSVAALLQMFKMVEQYNNN
ncbi:MAG TPA: amylo-alpha-1,6-glucosidase [Bacteroidales bacterium]